MTRNQWKVVKTRLRRRLDTWARVMVYRAEFPDERFPPESHLTGGSATRFRGGSGVSNLMSRVVEIEMALRDVPMIVQGVWIRMYGGASLVRRDRALRMIAGDCDLKGMIDVMNAWEARIADRLGIIRDVLEGRPDRADED